jgi:restriction endonuclease S subunit
VSRGGSFSELPDGWQWKRISWLFNSTGSGTTPSQQDIVEPSNDTVPWVTTGELRERRIVNTQKAITAETLKSYPALKLHPPGSLVIAMYGATIGRMALLDIASATNQACCVLSEPIAITPEFAQYSLLANRSRLIQDADGGGQPNINQEKVRALRIAVPPLDEQRAIADYLDRETARIDTLIEEQQRLIETLRERRQAQISHAVGCGLDGSAEVKASGLGAAPFVPAHWDVMPLRYAVTYQEGPGILAVDFRDEGVPLLRVSGVRTPAASLDGCNYLDPETVKMKWAHFRVEMGDLLISASASMGTVSEVRSTDVVGAVPYTGLIRIKPGRMAADFVRWFVVSAEFLDQVESLKAGSTIQHFGPSHLAQMRVALPPLNEQRSIAAYLDEETARIDTLIAETETFIELARERRSALITAAVTGQIDVR